ncbi:MAG: hypothetical protein R2750_13435 [Bacteroidales bacterium]
MKYKALVLVLFGLTASSLFSQVYERSRQETRTFKVYDQTSFELYNKYGNIHLFTWKQDSVKIEVSLKVKSSKESKADKIFEFIDFEFSNSTYYIIARTEYRQDQGAFWSELSDLASTVFSGGTQTQIDYKVYLPQNIPVKIENKFGNIYCTDHSSKFDINLSNGDFKANRLSGDVTLDLSFGNADIGSIKQGKIELGYEELYIGEAGLLNLASKSSEIRIEKIDELSLQSRRDKLFLEEVNTVKGESSFSYITMKLFSKSFIVKADYGEIKFKEIDPMFTLIDITSKYTDIDFKVAKDFSSAVSISCTEQTGMYYPDSFKGIMSNTDKETKQVSLTGTIGGQSAGNRKITVTIQSGKITFEKAD